MGTENMEFLQSASRICFVVAIAALVLAIALFFLLDIRNVFLIETGRAKVKAIQEMNERNAATGKLREDQIKHKESDKGNTRRHSTAESGADSGIGSAYERGDRISAARSGAAGNRSPHNTVEVDSTVILDSSPVKNRPGFTVTKRTIVIHTDERISV